MSHSGLDPESERKLREASARIFGEFPEGRLNANDEGAVAIGVGHQKGKVVIQFPKALTWVGMTPEQAMEVAESLVEHARACGCQRPLTLRVG